MALRWIKVRSVHRSLISKFHPKIVNIFSRLKNEFPIFFQFPRRILHFFCECLMIFSGFRAKFQKRVTSVVFQSILRKQIRKLPIFLKFMKIKLFNVIQYYSFVSLISTSTQPSWPAYAALMSGVQPFFPTESGTCSTSGSLS